MGLSEELLGCEVEKGFNSQIDVHMELRDVDYFVGKASAKKQILHKINAHFK